jgi:hypothetical protein
MSGKTRPEQVGKIVRAALAQTGAAQEHGLDSAERKRALAVQHAACRAASDSEGPCGSVGEGTGGSTTLRP